SLGGGANSSVNTAVANLTNAGVTVVVAAGNSNADACSFSPAGAASAITVGSTVSDDSRSSFSNFGSCLDIFGPGSSITSAWNTGTTATNTISGTSMASPHVAGAAALYLAVNPTASVSQVTSALIDASTPNKVTSAGSNSPNRLLYSLFSSGDPPPSGGSPPVINSFFCPDRGDSGGGTYVCRVTYTSATPATVAWTDTFGVVSTEDEMWGTCSAGSRLRFTATVSNASGAVSRTSSLFSCPTGPMP
ncbi:MAG: S8 family serine peptidase, partial [Lysobacter sp.]|nr:S8 family serine peptidase [Lysobacter sp.]